MRFLLKNIILALVAFFSFVGSIQANDCPIIRQQQSYNINQKFFTIGSDFDILSGEHKLGKVIQKVFNWGKTFELLNENGQLVAKARQQVVSFGVKVDVYDCQNRVIGSLQENILKSLFKIQTVYSIMDGNGQLAGQSKKLDFFGTDITFFNASGQLNASLSRPFINWMTDKWVLVLNGNSTVDSRILFFTAAYKTSADSDRNSDSSSSSSKK
ncbi:MAG: hypothetical protein A4S09_10885 [Proteobacteria bacterium SG_bin7]|nr:MAG: hypothetical protein A4S09_10885 [Proteobacteria bacterium SG_bin7]